MLEIFSLAQSFAPSTPLFLRAPGMMGEMRPSGRSFAPPSVLLLGTAGEADGTAGDPPPGEPAVGTAM